MMAKRVRLPTSSAVFGNGVWIGPPMPACRVHMLGLSAFKPVIENWTIGKNISRETYDKFKDANGDLYATEFREDGETKTHVLRKDKWEELRRRLEALG